MRNVPANAPVLKEMLKLGSSGHFVLKLQARLNAERLGRRLSEDGKLGEVTLRALVIFQRRHGLRADGIVGLRTAAALGWHFSAPSPKPYTIRMDRAPLSGMTPPQLAVAETLRTGFERLCYLLKLEIDKNGLSEIGRVNAKRNVDILYDILTYSLDEFTNNAELGEFDFLRATNGVLEFQVRALEMGVQMKNFGGKVKGYAELLERSKPLAEVWESIKPLIRGEQSAEITSAKVRLQFQAVLGPY